MEILQDTNIIISRSARKFMGKKGIIDVTFQLKVIEPAGCFIGIVKEIEPVYSPPEDAAGYHCFHVEGKNIFISKKIKILRQLTLTTEGFWKIKRLALSGVTITL